MKLCEGCCKQALPQLHSGIGLTKQKMQNLTTLAAYKLGLKIQRHNKYC